MFEYKKAICYSGYRENQSPITSVFPSDEEVYEDLMLLSKNFSYIRMYDPGEHAKSVLRVIKKHNIPLKVMLGAQPAGEISNPDCPWGGLLSDEAIKQHKITNYQQLDELAALVNAYPEIVLAASVGNENTASWHPNKMDPLTLRDHVLYLKNKVNVPVTFCEGGIEWRENCREIAQVVDFISIHCYPLWQNVPLKDAVEYTVNDYTETASVYKDKPVIFTEFGWATSAGTQMDKTQANEAFQKTYLEQMQIWAEKEKVTTFIFEAFDEPWKGGNDPDEPEKNWGIYKVDRTPKLWIK